MGTLTRVASRAEIAEGSGRCVEAGGRKLALFNVGGNLYAIDGVCKHRGGPLGEGELDGCNVVCPWHGWEYDVTTGKNIDDENIRLDCFAIRLEGDDILVEL